jgi:RNA polymerase sigma-54 factor
LSGPRFPGGPGGMSPRIELRQSQSLVMTPQLMQAIKLLQLSSLDLTAYVEAELEKNPLLDRDDEGLPESASGAVDTRSEADGESGERGGRDQMSGDATALGADSPGDLTEAASADMSQLTPAVDADLGEALDESASNGQIGGAEQSQIGPGSVEGRGGSFEANGFGIEDFASAEPTLHDALAEQLAMTPLVAADRLIATALIEAVDDAGYLQTDLDALAARLGTERAFIEAVLEQLQTFEPTGVFARNLAECLALQLHERDRFDPAMQALVENLDLLAQRDFPALCAICAVDHEDLVDMVAEIRALDPRPGSRFAGTPIQPVVPDVFVSPRDDSSWAIELNTDTLPRVLVNRGYYAAIIDLARNGEEKTYLNERLQEANWLVKSLDQRARTILKVSTEIVRQQDAFLTEGIAHLRPLNLKQVAEAIDMHESTVSRVTSNKFMATPRGVFELKYFFPTAIQSADGGDALSGESVRHRIRDLIDSEGRAVLSDDQIVKMLHDEGIAIARRTVAKYREAMNIPSSVHRRREKRLSA